MKAKSTYRVRNWSKYNKSLIARGSIKIWLSPEIMSGWSYKGKRRPGGVKKYTDHAIKACLIIKEVYKLSLRQCEGFLRSLSAFMPLKDIPSYTTLCRRMAKIEFDLLSQLKDKKNLHILVDSTGLKIYGEGEWYRKKHGVSKYSLWAKLHAAVDHASQKIVSIKRSDAHGYDSKYLGLLLDGLDIDISCIYGDGAYDKRICYKTAYELKSHLIAPVQRSARKQKLNRNYPNNKSLEDRDRKIDFIREFENEDVGRTLWKQVSGYHKRSLVETAMYRLKQSFGNRLNCRKEEHQAAQLGARAFALNMMTDLGMPKSVII